MVFTDFSPRGLDPAMTHGFHASQGEACDPLSHFRGGIESLSAQSPRLAAIYLDVSRLAWAEILKISFKVRRRAFSTNRRARCLLGPLDA